MVGAEINMLVSTCLLSLLLHMTEGCEIERRGVELFWCQGHVIFLPPLHVLVFHVPEASLISREQCFSQVLFPLQFFFQNEQFNQ